MFRQDQTKTGQGYFDMKIDKVQNYGHHNKGSLIWHTYCTNICVGQKRVFYRDSNTDIVLYVMHWFSLLYVAERDAAQFNKIVDDLYDADDHKN